MIIQKRRLSSGSISLKETLWSAANKMRGVMDASEYKHIVLGLIFLKFVSSNFIEYQMILRNKLVIQSEDPKFIESKLEDKDMFIKNNQIWVPKIARWENLQPTSGSLGIQIDKAMSALETHNPNLHDILPKGYEKKELDQRILEEVFTLIGRINHENNPSVDTLGGVYEYFLGKFAKLEGRRAGQFFTPKPVVRLLVELLQPFSGIVYDPCCGSGGMFIQSHEFITAKGGNQSDIAIYGQESNPTTWKLAKMNLAIRGIDADLGLVFADTFHNNQHKSLKANYILSNPPFNDRDWDDKGLLINDSRWTYGIPPRRNANYAWIQHVISHLSDEGFAGIVLANGSLNSQNNRDLHIRMNLIKNNLVDCIISLPSQLFISTTISACIWIINKNKSISAHQTNRDFILFIDGRDIGFMLDRRYRDMSNEDITLISSIYDNWKSNNEYNDVGGLCKSVSIQEVMNNNYNLIPGSYVDIENKSNSERD
ncbi:MAG: type I restriction-modification system subunit M, partial [Candidatus Heimdallarchaeota archaeon]|nr:type I restriction-modification system subunit M [Candidatus Heimdallarchaeota archaeon]